MKKNDKSKPLFTIQCYEDRQSTLQLRKPESIPTENPVSNGVKQQKEATDNPPPPPPMPITNGHQNGESKSVENQKAKAEKLDLMNSNIRKVCTLNRTPTPDYNNKESKNIKDLKNINDNAEIESLESYKLKNPLNVQPKPPSNYFVKAPNGTATMKKIARPVSVTIGEYVNNVGRREPLKLDFLNGDKVDGHIPDNEPISSRLQSELALTLSRSNLRKKTEALDKTVKMSVNTNALAKDAVPLDKNFHARYGNNLLPLSPAIRIPKVSKPKH